MLSAQRDRIDALFVQNPSWAYSAWRERYLDHPLVGTLARRIIWRFETEDGATTGMWWNGRLVDASGQAMAWLDNRALVRLWHPIDASVDEISAWRSWLLEHRVQQPFKQAHREIYVLTDAERSTGTYSNRFAAHILKQHQFNALCRVRGWRNALRLAVDTIYEPPTIDLPQWDLRAELWVQGVMSDPDFQEGVDITEAGSYLYVATDQLRFYRRHAAPNWAHAQGGPYESAGADIELNHPVPLEDVPVLALSEVMRDVDLFVGVASVGNDPAWADGGSATRFHDYARRYGMGNLSTLAKTRKALLEQLVPRLAIADRCHVREQHLVVRGELRIYKIHLGSGNILMEPNDQYLCIVPKAADRRRGSEDVFLPFEGDRMLSIILSKAFMLAADNTITDSTIRRQIGA
jgi:hypothetical protein